MRPLTVLLGIIMGSSVALAAGLTMTAIVFLFLQDYAARLEPERLPLLKGLLWSWSMAAISVAAFIGELRERRWRIWPALALAVMLVTLGAIYWPRT